MDFLHVTMPATVAAGGGARMMISQSTDASLKDSLATTAQP